MLKNPIAEYNNFIEILEQLIIKFTMITIVFHFSFIPLIIHSYTKWQPELTSPLNPIGVC